MRTSHRGLVILSLVVLGLGLPRPAGSRVPDQEQPKPASAFDFSFDVTLPAPPVEVYDALTGDITGWWDHSFAEKPFRLYIEPKPGGGFYEIFDQSGDGARHATVIYAILHHRAVQALHRVRRP